MKTQEDSTDRDRTAGLRTLVTLASTGDTNAFGTLVERFQDMAVGYASGILGDPHLAEDVAQEAFINAWEKIRQLEDPEKVGRSGCGGAFAAVVKKADRDMFDLLLSKGVRVPDVVTGCRTYLWSRPEMTRVLLENGMNPNLPNWLRTTPLHDLCDTDGKGRGDENRHELLDLFLEFGANINAVEEEYCSTPLGWAARNGLEDMVEKLLEKGADPNLPGDIAWATPLAWAEKRGHDRIAGILRQHGAKG